MAMLKTNMALSEKDSNQCLDENLTDLPVERVDTRGLYQKRPPCKQIEKSLEDIEAMVLQGGPETIKIFPKSFPEEEAYTNLKTRLNELSTVDNVGLAYIANSLPVTANMDIKYKTPGEVIMDVCLFRQRSPAVIFSVVTDVSKNMKLNQRYNSAVSKNVTKNVRKFTTMTFNSIYGLMHEKDLMSKETFESSLARIEKERSRLCIPDSLSMNNKKYKHVVRAFLSSMAATEFVSDENDETLWFLTHKQFCILTENIDHTEVHVDTFPASGGRVLSLTVCQRLQKLGRTLLISDDLKLIERARNHNIDCKTFNDIGQKVLVAEGNHFPSIVIYQGEEDCSSQSPHLPKLLSNAQKCWIFHRQKGSLEKEDMPKSPESVTHSPTLLDYDADTMDKVRNLLDDSCAEIAMGTKDVHVTSAVDEVISMLEGNNQWITITGRPGEGKTTLGYMVLEQMKAKGARICIIDSPNDYALFSANALTNHVFMFKDVLTYATCDLQTRKRWVEFVNNLHKSIKGECDTNVCFILICNKHDEEWKYLGGYAMEIFYWNVFNLTDHFRENPDERTKVLTYFLHKYQNTDQNIETNIACAKHGFLLCVKLFCELRKTIQTEHVHSFFSDPILYVTNLVTDHAHDEGTMTFLRSMLQHDEFTSTEEAVIPKPLSQFHGVFLQEDNNIRFCHPSVRVAVAMVMGKVDLLFVLQNCSSTFVIPRLKVQATEEEAGFLYVNAENKEVLRKVTSTFACALQEGYFDVLRHDMLLDETFFQQVLREAKNTSSTFLNELNTDGYSLLHAALRHGNKVAVQVLLDMEANVKVKCHGKSVLHLLCEETEFDKDLFLLFCEKGADISAVDEDGQTILHYLCMKSGSDTTIQLVLKRGCDATVTDHSRKTALHYLCAKRHIDKDLFTALIQRDCNVNMCDKWGKNVLHYLCESSVFDREIFHIAFSHRVDVSAIDIFGNTPLHYAAETSHPLKVIDLLIQNGSNINCRNARGDTISLRLCKFNVLQRDLLEYLIRHDTDVNAADEDGKTIIMILAENGNLNAEMLDLLMKAGCDVNKQDALGNTPLHYCCISGDVNETLRCLLEYGANVNHSNTYMKTPLHYAFERMVPRVIEQLIHYGADTNATDKDGMTPLLFLCENTRTTIDIFTSCLNALLEGKCDLNKSDKEGKTALHYVCERQKNTDMACVLIQAGAKVNMRDNHGSTPLHYICAWEGVKDLSVMVNMLINQGSRTNICDEWKRVPLHILCKANDIDQDTLKILLNNGGTVNARDVFKKTPLHYACDHTPVNREAIMLLIHGRADVNIADGNKRTPLHVLCMQKHIDKEAVNILLEKRAFVNTTDEHGKTALHYVSQNESSTKEIVSLILQNGADLDKTDGLGISVSEYLLKRTDLKQIVPLAILKKRPAVEDYSLRFQQPNGKQEVFAEIVRTGAFDKKDRHGRTFLHYACALSTEDDGIIEQTLQLDCDVNLKDPDNMTALHIICRRTNENVHKYIALLLQKGARVDMTDRHGNTPLHYLGMTSIIAERNATHLELLLNRGSDVKSVDGNGISFVHYMAIAGICDKIKVALDETKDVDVTVKHDVSTFIHKGQTALHLACISSKAGAGVVNELLKSKANICATDRRGRTPLHYACRCPCEIAYDATTNELTSKPSSDNLERKKVVELLLAQHMKKRKRGQRPVDENSTSDSGLGEFSDSSKTTTKSTCVPVPPAVKDYVAMTDDSGRSAFHYLCSRANIDNDLFHYMISLDPTVMESLVNKSDYNGLTVLHSLVLSGSRHAEKIIKHLYIHNKCSSTCPVIDGLTDCL
ncbi:uncharacterized protein LOC124256427 isoform X2 [Haliotis rubra]|uniref:uncharacterized protein LOC124256427 isoform X2 n=1 Tax=Haliotis rubra TaxID=36100 RepID=UPI001EE4EE18|nr:uncharacterized protein LOC124256427 isoform X2 [Haliotis rubra]